MNRNSYIYVEKDLISDRVQYAVTSQGDDQAIQRHDTLEDARADAKSRLLGSGEVVEFTDEKKS